MVHEFNSTLPLFMYRVPQKQTINYVSECYKSGLRILKVLVVGNYDCVVRFEDFTAVTMKNGVF
jgi:hypothetical protein